MSCPHSASRWYRHGDTVQRRCLACDAILARDNVVKTPPTPALANQMDPAELAAFEL